MAKTITISIPPNTSVSLPDSETLSKAVSAGLVISVDNQSGETIELEQSGSASSFSVEELPATIADSADDDISLSVLAAGSLVFTFNEDEETVEVEILAAESAGAGLLLLGVG